MLENLRLIRRLLPLLLVILIDSTSYTIIVPVLAATLIDDSHLMMIGYGDSARYIVYGLALGIFELTVLYMAPVLGELSDRMGRRRILILCMSGLVISFLITSAALIYNLVGLLLIARVIGGGTSGSQAVAQAAAVDLSNESNKQMALSFCLFASSIGFIIGPVIGGSMSFDDNISLADFTIPILITAAVAVVGIILLWTMFHDERPAALQPAKLGKIDLMMGLRGLKAALVDPAVRRLVVIFGLLQMSWGTYFLFLPSLLFSRFDLDTGTASLYMGFLGIGFCIAYGICLPLLEKRVAPRVTAIWGLWATVVLLGVAFTTESMVVQWIIGLPVAITVSVAYGAIITLFSDAVDEERQGWVLGITISTGALAWGSSSIIAGLLSGMNYLAPFALAFACMLGSAIAAMTPDIIERRPEDASAEA